MTRKKQLKVRRKLNKENRRALRKAAKERRIRSAEGARKFKGSIGDLIVSGQRGTQFNARPVKWTGPRLDSPPRRKLLAAERVWGGTQFRGRSGSIRAEAAKGATSGRWGTSADAQVAHALVSAIANGRPSRKVLFRGERRSEAEVEALRPGAVLPTSIVSFTDNFPVAQEFAEFPETGEPGRHRKGVRVVQILKPGARVHDFNDEGETLAMGDFKVETVGRFGSVRIVVISQIATPR